MIPTLRWRSSLVCPVVFWLLCLCSGSMLGQQTGGVNPSHSFGPDQCGPADPSYIKTANETGGVPLFLQRSEAGKVMQLMRESSRENVSTVLWASAKLEGGVQEFNIPVDSMTERISFTFSVNSKGSRLVLRDPDGQEVVAGSARTEDTELNCGRLITVEKPPPGMWHAEVTASGTYWLQVQAQSDIYFIKAEFVEVRGRLGHEGLFKIAGQPIAGQPATLQASLSASDAKTAELAFANERGEVLEKMPMKITDPNRDFLELTGEVALPKLPFRVAVIGRDTKGESYQRFYGPLFHAETVQVIPKLDFDEIAPGEARKAIFAVRNLAEVRSFKVMATDARRIVTRVEPAELTIGAHESGLVEVELAVPAAIANVFDDNLVIVVSSTTGAATSNSAIVKLSIADHTGR